MKVMRTKLGLAVFFLPVVFLLPPAPTAAADTLSGVVSAAPWANAFTLDRNPSAPVRVVVDARTEFFGLDSADDLRRGDPLELNADFDRSKGVWIARKVTLQDPQPSSDPEQGPGIEVVDDEAIRNDHSSLAISGTAEEPPAVERIAPLPAPSIAPVTPFRSIASENTPPHNSGRDLPRLPI